MNINHLNNSIHIQNEIPYSSNKKPRYNESHQKTAKVWKKMLRAPESDDCKKSLNEITDEIVSRIIESSRSDSGIDWDMLDEMKGNTELFLAVFKKIAYCHFYFVMTHSRQLLSKNRLLNVKMKRIVINNLFEFGILTLVGDSATLNLNNLESYLVDYRSRLSNLFKNIDKLSFPDVEVKQAFIMKMAKCQETAQEITRHPHLFQFADTHFKQSLALEMTKHDEGARSVATDIDKFAFEDRDFLQNLARRLVKFELAALFFASNIDEFKIDDPKVLKELADEMVKLNLGSCGLAGKIDKFIVDPKLRPDYALKIVAHRSGASALAKSLKKFFEDPEIIREYLLKIVQHALGASSLAENIAQYREYAFCDEEFLKKLALEIVKYNDGARELVRHIEDFGFSNREFINDLAQKIVKHRTGAEYFVLNVKKFRIDDLSLRKKLALQIAKTDLGPEQLARHIEDFNIEDPQFKMLLALEIARNRSARRALVRNIHCFIPDERLANEFKMILVSQEYEKKDLRKLITFPHFELQDPLKMIQNIKSLFAERDVLELTSELNLLKKYFTLS
ncbi:MAG: hypothetical protein K940chlam3_00311, partial [Chlamydiae bacterium]|nr:hypothetical protein [Chlamydiota bacterium]